MLDLLTTSGSDQNSSLSSARKVILDTDILGQVCCHGALSESVAISQLSRQLLSGLFSQREEPFLSDVQQLLPQWMPYIEVCSCHHAVMHAHLYYESEISVCIVNACIPGTGARMS